MVDDPYVYSGTSVLINQFGIKDPETLAVVEGRFFVLRSLEPLPVGQWDYEHLKAIHHHFFRDLYSWAGQERTVDLAKNNSYFAHVPFIAATLDQRFKQLKEECYLQNLPLSTFCERLSYYFNEVNAVHPFREGNGRTQRAFFSSLAEQAGYYLDWKLLATRKEDYATGKCRRILTSRLSAFNPIVDPHYDAHQFSASISVIYRNTCYQ